MIKIETERLILREFNNLDLDNLFNLLSDPRVMEYCSGALDYKNTQKWLQAIQEYYNKYGYDYWAAIEKISGEFIGQIGILRQEVNNELLDCIAFILCKEKWKHGYATEGGKKCIDYGFKILKLKKIYATVEPGNTASKYVLEKIGMTDESDVMSFGKKNHLYSIELK